MGIVVQDQYAEPDPFGNYDDQQQLLAEQPPEPPITVAVLAGGSGTDSQRSASLASARALLENLQTAPYDLQRESLRALLASESEEASAQSSWPDSASLPEDLRRGGINVHVYWLDRRLQPHRITAADLCARSVPDLDHQLPAHAEALPSIQVRSM